MSSFTRSGIVLAVSASCPLISLPGLGAVSKATAAPPSAPRTSPASQELTEPKPSPCLSDIPQPNEFLAMLSSPIPSARERSCRAFPCCQAVKGLLMKFTLDGDRSTGLGKVFCHRQGARVFHLRVFFGFCLLYAVFFSPVWLAGRLIAPDDGVSLFMASFCLPKTLWTTSVLAGFPVGADPEVQTFYPLNVLFSLLPFGWNWLTISAYVIASFTSYLLAYRLTGLHFPSIAALVVWGMIAFFVIHACAWLPLLLLAVLELKAGGGFPWVVAGAAATALSALSGHPQMTFYGLAIACGYAIWSSLPLESWRARAVFLASCAVMLVLGAGLAAVQYVPTLELAMLSKRLHMSYLVFSSYCIYPFQLVQLFYPMVMGGSPGTAYGVGYFGPPGLETPAHFVGLLPIFLSVIAFFAKSHRHETRFWILAGALSLLLSMGDATPLGRLTYALPVYQHLRCPYRRIIAFVLAASLLSALALRAIELKLVSRKLVVRVIVFGAALVVSLLFPILQFTDLANKRAHELGMAPVGFYPWANPATGVPLIVLALSAAALLFWMGRPGSQAARAALAAALLIDLGSYGWFSFWRTESYSPDLLTVPAPLLPYREKLVTELQRCLPARGRSGGWLECPPTISRLWGVPSVSGHGPLITQRMHELMMMAEGGFVEQPSVAPLGCAPDLTAVRFGFAPADRATGYAGFFEDPSDPGHWAKAGDLPGAAAYENRRAMPRCWLVPAIAVLSPDEILQVIHRRLMPDGSRFHPGKIALVEEPVPLAGAGHAGTGRARVTSLKDMQEEIEVDCPRPAFLVASDSFYPGWTATVDGIKTRLYQTDYVLRGVAVPAGRHVVRFQFVPLSYYWGLGGTALSLIVLRLGWALSRARRRRAGEEPLR